MNPKTRFVSLKTFKEIAGDKAVEQENVAIRKSFVISKMEEINGSDEKPTLKFSITTQDVDRDGDTVALGGWDFSDFAKNPVVLWAHDYSTPPVAKAINIFRDVASIDSTAEFTPKSMNEFGFMIYQMYKGGFLSAVSVGFQPSDFETAKDREGGLNFIRQSLMEYSAVPVPSNPNALIQARSIGINTAPMKAWAENILDDWEATEGVVLMPKNEIELIRTTADEKSAVSVAVKNEEISHTSALESTGAESGEQNTSDESGEESKGDQESETTVSSGSEGDNEEINEDELHSDQENECDKSWPVVNIHMCSLLGGDGLPPMFDAKEQREVYDDLAKDYERFNKTIPEYRFVEAHVLRNMPDDFYYDYETGQVEKLTEEIEVAHEIDIVTEILVNCAKNAKTEHVKNAAAEALNAFKDYKDLDCCTGNEHDHKNSDNQAKGAVGAYFELEDEGDEVKNDALFDDSISKESIAEMIRQGVDEAMRKRMGRLD